MDEETTANDERVTLKLVEAQVRRLEPRAGRNPELEEILDTLDRLDVEVAEVRKLGAILHARLAAAGFDRKLVDGVRKMRREWDGKQRRLWDETHEDLRVQAGIPIAYPGLRP